MRVRTKVSYRLQPGGTENTRSLWPGRSTASNSGRKNGAVPPFGTLIDCQKARRVPGESFLHRSRLQDFVHPLAFMSCRRMSRVLSQAHERTRDKGEEQQITYPPRPRSGLQKTGKTNQLRGDTSYVGLLYVRKGKTGGLRRESFDAPSIAILEEVARSRKQCTKQAYHNDLGS